MSKVDRENQNTEWKENWQEKYLEWICGMANCDGGTIYLGYNDNGEPKGISEENIKNKISRRNRWSPDYTGG